MEKDKQKADLAAALEPFGYRREPLEQPTTWGALPSILQDFQNSRQTVYFPDTVIEALKHSSGAYSDPNKPVNDEELDQLFLAAKLNNHKITRPPLPQQNPSGEDQRIRTAESPPSPPAEKNQLFAGSRSPSPPPVDSQDHPQDTSFESQDEPSPLGLTDLPSSPSNLPAFNRLHTADRRLSIPLDFGDTHHRKPKPPNRWKRLSHTLEPHTPSAPTHSTHTSPSSNIPQDLDPNLSLNSSTDQPSPDLLTPNNLSSVIFKNRQLGLYDPFEDHDPPPSSGSDANPNDFLRTLRPQSPSRPDSKVYTRVFDSSVMRDLDHRLRDDDGRELPQSNSEDYARLMKRCEAFKLKNKELQNQISQLERIHEDEIIRLTDQVDELTQELSSCKKSEKDLSTTASKLSFQLSTSDDHIARMAKEWDSLQDSYQKIKLKWDEAVGESEKLRAELQLRNEELRAANRRIDAHASDMKKWESDQQLREAHIKTLKAEMEGLQHTGTILDEQKQANLDLKMTIDKLKYELEDQRMRNAGSSVGGSRPPSLAGSSNPRLGEEFKRAIAAGELEGDTEGDEDQMSGSEATAEDETEELTRIVRNFDDPSLAIDQPEIFDEIRIRRFSRRTTVIPGNRSTGDDTLTHQEVIELRDAETDTDDLLSSETKKIQTDPIPEPPPVYRPKTSDLQVQTDGSKDDKAGRALLNLVTGIDPDVLKLAIDHILHQHAMDAHARPPRPSSRSSRSESELDESSDDADEVDPNDRPRLFSSRYLSRWGLSAIRSLSPLDRSIFSRFAIFNPMSRFKVISTASPAGDSLAETQESGPVARQRRPQRDRRAAEAGRIDGDAGGKLAQSLRVCSQMLVLVVAGYALHSLVATGGRAPGRAPACVDSAPSSDAAAGPTLAVRANASLVTRRATLRELVDANAVAAGAEGFVVHCPPRLLGWLAPARPGFSPADFGGGPPLLAPT